MGALYVPGGSSWAYQTSIQQNDAFILNNPIDTQQERDWLSIKVYTYNLDGLVNDINAWIATNPARSQTVEIIDNYTQASPDASHVYPCNSTISIGTTSMSGSFNLGHSMVSGRVWLKN